MHYHRQHHEEAYVPMCGLGGQKLSSILFITFVASEHNFRTQICIFKYILRSLKTHKNMFKKKQNMNYISCGVSFFFLH